MKSSRNSDASRSSAFSGAVNRRAILSNGLKLAAGTGLIGFPNLLARAATPLNFQLSWIKSGQYAGFFAGLEKGYYKEADLDVTFNSGGPNIDSIANVAAGRSA